MGDPIQANSNFNPGTTYDASYVLEFGVKRDSDVIRYSLGLIDDEFTTSFRYREPERLPNGVWVDRDGGESVTTSYYLHVGFGYSSQHLHSRFAMIPILNADVQFVTVLGSMGNRSGAIATDVDDPSTNLLTTYDYVDRRITPFLILGGSYDLFGGNRLSIPISFGYRIPVFRRYQYSDGFVSVHDAPVTFQRVEKTGAGRHLQIGVTYRF